MAESVGTLTADLNLGGISQFQAGLKKAGSGFNKLGAAAKIAGGLIVGAIAFKAVKAISEGVTSLIQFQKAMAEVGTLTNATAEETSALADNVRELSVQFGAPAVETAAALYQTISAGFGDAADSSKILTTALKLGIGGVTDTTTAVDGLTTILSSYGISASESTDVSDKLFIAMRAGKTTIGELSRAMGSVTSISAVLGVSLEEVLAATSAITTGGIKTKVAVTNLRQVFVNILKPTAQAAQLAKALGLEFNAAALRSKGLAGFLEDVRVKTGGSTEAMSLLFGSVEAVQGVLALTGPQMETFNSIQDQMKESAGASEAAFKTMAETTDFKIKQLNEAWDKFKTTLADAVLPTITTAVEALGDIVKAAGDAVTSLDGLGNRLDAVAKKQQAAADAAKSQEERISSAQETLQEFGLTLGEIEDIFITGTSAVSAFAGIDGLEGLEKQVALLISEEDRLKKANSELFDSMSGVSQKAAEVAKAVGDVLGGAVDKAKDKVKGLKEEMRKLAEVLEFETSPIQQMLKALTDLPTARPTPVRELTLAPRFEELGGEINKQLIEVGGTLTPDFDVLSAEIEKSSQGMGGMSRVLALLGAEASGVSAALATGDLLGAAIALVAGTGVLDSTMEAVAETINITVGAFAGFFDGIAALVDSIRPITTFIGKVLKPVFDALGAIFIVIGKVILTVQIAILQVANALSLGLAGLGDDIKKLKKQRRELGKAGKTEEEEEAEARFIDKKNALTSAKFSRSLEGGQLRDAVEFAAQLDAAGKLSETSALKLADALEEAGAGAAAQSLAEFGSAGAADALRLAMEPAALAALASAERSARLEEANKRLEKSTEKLKDTTNNLNQSFSQLPSGFKIASAAFATGTAFTRREAAGGVAGRAEAVFTGAPVEGSAARGLGVLKAITINIAQQNNQVKDVPDFVRQLDEERERRELALAGFAASGFVRMDI